MPEPTTPPTEEELAQAERDDLKFFAEEDERCPNVAAYRVAYRGALDQLRAAQAGVAELREALRKAQRLLVCRRSRSGHSPCKTLPESKWCPVCALRAQQPAEPEAAKKAGA